MSKQDDLIKQLLAAGGTPSMTKEEMEKANEKLVADISANFKKIETKDIVRCLVTAENLLTIFIRSDPALTRQSHNDVAEARALISAVLDGNIPPPPGKLN